MKTLEKLKELHGNGTIKKDGRLPTHRAYRESCAAIMHAFPALIELVEAALMQIGPNSEDRLKREYAIAQAIAKLESLDVIRNNTESEQFYNEYYSDTTPISIEQERFSKTYYKRTP